VIGRERPQGSSAGVPSGVPVALVFGPWRGRSSTSHIRIGFPIRTSLLSGEPEDRSWWMPGRNGTRFFGTGFLHPALRSRVRPIRFFGTGRSCRSGNSGVLRGGRARRVRFLRTRRMEAGQPASLPAIAVSSERRKAHESSGRGGPRFAAVRISTESKALELRGIVTSWSSEQEHAMSKTA
jgi:hypothetical protein